APPYYKNRAVTRLHTNHSLRGGSFQEPKRTAKTVLPGVLLDCNAVVHLIDTQNLGFPAIASELVVLAHDQRLDRLGRADFGAQTAEAAAREIEVEVVEHLDLRPRLAVFAERDEIVGTRLGEIGRASCREECNARCRT